MKQDTRTARCIQFIHSLVLIGIGIAIGYHICHRRSPEPMVTRKPSVAALFSPGGGCTDAIVLEIDAAKREILIQAYSFTSRDIAAAVVRAARRGVRVEAILDATNRTGRYSAATFLSHAGVPVLIDDQHAIAHNKIMILDRSTVITGSFNFTRAAEERNAENLVIIRDPTIARAYLENYSDHKSHCVPFDE